MVHERADQLVGLHPMTMHGRISRWGIAHLFVIEYDVVMNATDLIKALRAAGLSQSEISRRTGIPQPRVSRWESGDAPAGANDALRLHALHEEVQAAAAASPQGAEVRDAA